MAKIYSLIDHSTRPSRRAYICASSKKEVAEIVGKPLSHIDQYLSVATGDLAEKYSHLKQGEMTYEEEHKVPTGMSQLDLERISALGYLKMARMSLSQCELSAEEKDRLAKIMHQIDELRADVSERLDKKYRGR